MGLLIAQLRLAQLRNFRSDLEYQTMLISSTKMSFTSQINDLVGLASEMDPDSPEMKALEGKKERLQQMEKALDAQLQNYQTQLQLIDAEEQSVKEQISNSIQRMYA